MKVGDVIDGRYQVEEKLGQGGMGQVFRGHDNVLNKTIAIKVLFPNTSDLVVKRFHAEAVALAQLKHPNILSVQQFGQSDDGTVYLITDYIKGESLSSLIENRGAQTFFDVLPIFERICRGLRFAHAKNVLHRDIKPSNVMLDTDRSRDDSVKLVDFGLAKQADKDFDLTKTGSAIGTPAYMSPEAIHGNEGDERTDIYALGCTFFEMMAGRPPFFEGSPMDTMMCHLHQPPPTLSEVSSRDFEPEVEQFIQRCLKKDPDERFKNIDELIAELTSVKELLLEKKDASLSSSMYASGLLLASKTRVANRSLWRRLLLLFSLLILVGYVVTVNGAFVQWKPSKDEVESKEVDKAIGELESETQKLQEQEDIQNLVVDGKRAGVLYETGGDGEMWCRVFGKLTDKQLEERLQQYKTVPNYSLENLTASSDALDSILELPIEKLMISEVDVTNDLLLRLAKMKQLSSLTIIKCGELPANFLRHFKTGRLNAIRFEMGKNNEFPGAELASLKELQKITLANGRLGRSDIRAIVSGLNLRSLNLAECTLSPDALIDLKLARDCVALTAVGMKLTTQQFEDISKIPPLAYLNLSLSNVDNNALRSFRRSKNLQRLILVKTGVTPTGVSVLKASVPKVQAILTAQPVEPF